MNNVRGFNIKEYFVLIASSILIALLLAVIQSKMSVALLLLIFLSLTHIFWNKIILGVIIVSYLSTLTDFVGEVRILFNLVFTAILLYLFFKEYGLRFSTYPKLPAIIIAFIMILFFTLITSTLFSDFAISGIHSIISTFLFFVIVYMIYSLIKSIKEIYIIIYSLIFSVCIIAARMLLDFFTLGFEIFFNKIAFQGEIELYGSAGYTGYAIFFISFTLLCSLFFINNFSSKGNKYFHIVLLMVHLSVLFLSNSRALIAGVVFSMILMLSVLNRRLLFKATLFLVLLTVIVISIPTAYNAIELYIRLDSVNQRNFIWQTGIDIISDNWVFGIGPRAFPNYFFSYAPSHIFDYLNLPIWKYGVPHPHNLFIYYWAENGLLGLSTAILFFIIYFYISIKSVKTAKKMNKDYYILALTSVGIGLGMLFRAFFDVGGILTYGYISADLPFWLAFIILLFIYESKDTISEHSKN